MDALEKQNISDDKYLEDILKKFTEKSDPKEGKYI
jgi:hypothetical protein